MSEHAPFVANQNLADTLQLELSAASPEQQMMLRDTVSQVKITLLKQHAPFVQSKALASTANLEERVVLTDQETFQTFRGSWSLTDQTPVRGVMGTSFQLGELIILNDPDEAWWTFKPDSQALFAEHFGSEAVARHVLARVSLADTLTHEVVHQYQDDSLPPALLEVAVRYYQRQITTELGLGHIENDIATQSLNLYTDFVMCYGNSLHSVFFGKPIPSALRTEIITELTSRSTEMLPGSAIAVAT